MLSMPETPTSIAVKILFTYALPPYQVQVCAMQVKFLHTGLLKECWLNFSFLHIWQYNSTPDSPSLSTAVWTFLLVHTTSTLVILVSNILHVCPYHLASYDSTVFQSEKFCILTIIANLGCVPEWDPTNPTTSTDVANQWIHGGKP